MVNWVLLLVPITPSGFMAIRQHLTDIYLYVRKRGGRDRMVVGLTTTYAIRAYHH
jgi:hypothetical protein